MNKIFTMCLMAFALVARGQWDPFSEQDILIEVGANHVSIQCEGVGLGKVLARLSDVLGHNVLLADAFPQPVTLNIHHLPKNTIMQQLVESYSLRAIERDGMMVIFPSMSTGEPQRVKTYLLQYAQAQDMAEMLKSRLQSGFDARTNALIVYNAPEHMGWLDALIAELDVPAKQVYIEATIMNASEVFTKELGLRFRVDEFSVADLPDHIPLQVAIAAAQEKHQTQVIANPKLLTLNMQEAHIKQGKQLAYQENSASGATSLTFQEAALELKVTPMITPEHDIVLNLNVKQDMISNIAINGQPSIDTKSIQAKVRVKDGHTVVLGGIYSQSDHAQNRSVPFLARLPVIGLLFREKRQNDGKDELLIFVTPRVVL